MSIAPPIAKEIEELLKKRYRQPASDDNSKIIEGIQSFASHIQMRRSAKNLLQDAARAVHRIFPFQEIAVGLKSTEDGLYRYEAFIGYSHEAEDAFRKSAYTYEEFFSPKDFPSIRVCKLIDMIIVENEPALEKEQACWNRPILLKVPRKSPDEFTEGDYLDVLIYGEDNEMIGWLELSAPRDGRMPSATTLKGLELFAGVLSLALQALAPERKLTSAKR